MSRSGPRLPLVTQPILPIRNPDNPLAGIDPALTLPALTTESLSREIDPRSSAVVVFGKTRPVPAGPPPEIGLTQHALPDDSKPDGRLALFIDPDSERSASFRVLRHHLLAAQRPQVVIVSSPNPSEGKTMVAVNLALAFAECGRAKVLLADAHLGRPQLAQVLHLVPPWCFAEQLAAHRHQPLLPWSFIDIPQLWLHVAAINPRIERSQLLDAPAFAIAMERLRLAGYDHIVIDAPQVLGSADVNLMADSADAVVLALRTRKSTTRDLRRAIDQIGVDKVAGTVLVE